jgi:streptogramin lyase
LEAVFEFLFGGSAVSRARKRMPKQMSFSSCTRGRALFAGLGLAIALAACSGTGNTVPGQTSHATPSPSPSGTPAATATPSPSATATPAPSPTGTSGPPASNTQTVKLGPALTVSFAKIYSGAAGSVSFPPTTSGQSSATISLQSTLPSGVPAPQVFGTAVAPLAYIVVDLSNAVSFRATPGLTFTFPTGVLAGYAYFAFFDPANPQLGWNALAGPVAAGGTSVTIASVLDASPPLALSPNLGYVFAIVENLTVVPTPTPAPDTVIEYQVPNGGGAGLNNGIAKGPDGNIWFTEFTNDNIDKITPGGSVTQYPIPGPSSGPQGIAAGPDGNLWFAENVTGQIGKITPAGAITQYSLPNASSGPLNITAGPDGNLWFTEFASSAIGKITTSGTVTEYPLPISGSRPFNPQLFGITAGPDGNVWFTEYNDEAFGGNNIGKITPSGAIQLYQLPQDGLGPIGITTGPDGNLWFVENGGGQVAKITPGGVFSTDSESLGFDLQEIAKGPDGNLWVTYPANNIYRITPDYAASEYWPPLPNLSPDGIIAGADGNMWFTEDAGYIGKLIVR